MSFTQRGRFVDATASACVDLILVPSRRSPFAIEVEDPQRDLLDPAIKGTDNVLSSVAKHKHTVQRTIVTSSVAGAVTSAISSLSLPIEPKFAPVSAAVLGNESAVPPKNGSLYTEDDWNETSSIKNNEAYWLSKVLCRSPF